MCKYAPDASTKGRMTMTLLAVITLSLFCGSCTLSRVEITNNQAYLAKVAKKDKNDVIRIQAVKRINDPALLAYFAKNDKNDLVRHTATEKLDDQVLLADIAKNDKSDYVREAAVKRLDDQVLLADYAKNHNESSGIRVAAAVKLGDRALLVNFVNKGETRWQGIRERAMRELLIMVGKISDRVLLQEIAEKDECKAVEGVNYNTTFFDSGRRLCLRSGAKTTKVFVKEEQRGTIFVNVYRLDYDPADVVNPETLRPLRDVARRRLQELMNENGARASSP
jgi:hypothetical protein